MNHWRSPGRALTRGDRALHLDVQQSLQVMAIDALRTMPLKQ